MSILGFVKKDTNTITIDLAGNYADYEFAIDGAFTAPIRNQNSSEYVFGKLNPNTQYRISVYNYDQVNQIPTTEKNFLYITTLAGNNTIGLTMFLLYNLAITHNSIMINLVHPDTDPSLISINDGFAPPEVTLRKGYIGDNAYIELTGLSPSTTYSIQFHPTTETISDSFYLKTADDPPIVDPPDVGDVVGATTQTRSGLSDGAIIGIIFGSIFGLWLIYAIFYLK